ncbi:MAG TPA: hypothetical protein VIU93_09040 [Gallionellaceae bacterium]
MRPHVDSLRGRKHLLGCSLLALMVTATCSARSVAGEAPQPEQAAKPARPHGAAKRAPEENRVELERLEKAPPKQKGKGGNAFGATSWYVPPPPPKPLPPPPPPPPTAPPMPFSYLGLYEGSSGKVIMLVRGDHIYTVGVGDVIDNTYRIDRFDHGTVEMTYLPLNIKQSLSTGNPS